MSFQNLTITLRAFSIFNSYLAWSVISSIPSLKSNNFKSQTVFNSKFSSTSKSYFTISFNFFQCLPSSESIQGSFNSPKRGKKVLHLFKSSYIPIKALLFLSIPLKSIKPFLNFFISSSISVGLIFPHLFFKYKTNVA